MPSVVLVVDDDLAICEAIGGSLSDSGYQVVHATNGLAALDRIRDGLRPNVILLDLMMPVLDGWGFYRELKQYPEHRGIPIVVMSAGGSAMLMSAPVAADYLTKPLELEELLATIERLCG